MAINGIATITTPLFFILKFLKSCRVKFRMKLVQLAKICLLAMNKSYISLLFGGDQA
jgi:hypothetical protein